MGNQKTKGNGDQHVHNLEATYVTKVTSSQARMVQN